MKLYFVLNFLAGGFLGINYENYIWIYSELYKIFQIC